MPQKPVAMATGGGTDDSQDFEDYVSEINDIEQGRHSYDKEDENICKTPDGKSTFTFILY